MSLFQAYIYPQMLVLYSKSCAPNLRVQSLTRVSSSYPLSCIRLQPVHCCPRDNLQGAIYPFISDLVDRLQSICSLPVRMTSQPCYPTSSLTSSGSAQVCMKTHTYTHSNTLHTRKHKFKSCTCKPQIT